jgi:hypothetical protein
VQFCMSARFLLETGVFSCFSRVSRRSQGRRVEIAPYQNKKYFKYFKNLLTNAGKCCIIPISRWDYALRSMVDFKNLHINILGVRKMRKKITSMLLIVMLIWGTFASNAHAGRTIEGVIDSLSVSALYTLQQTVREDLLAAEEYAYLDSSEATPAAKAVILAARENIIFHNSWVTEGVVGWIFDSEGEIVEYLPQFSDLFPDWDVPIQAAQSRSGIVSDSLSSVAGSATTIVPASVNATTSTNAPTFCQYTCNTILVGVVSLSGPANCNLGITRISDGYSLGYVEYVPVGGGMGAGVANNILLGARTSTYSTPGTGTFSVERYF